MRQQRDRGAEIGLLGDQQEWNEREEPADDEIAGIAGAAAVFAEEHRENERDGEARKFRRLQIEGADIDPALRAELRRALQQHEHEKAAETEIQEQRMLGEHAVVEHETDEQREQAERQRVHLSSHLRARMAIAIGQVDVGGAVDHGDADTHQQEHRSQQQPVDVEEESSLEHLRAGHCCPPPARGGAGVAAVATTVFDAGGAVSCGSGLPSFLA